MIQITMTDGSYREWPEDKYTDYMVNGGLFVVLQDSKWVGIYNLKMIKDIEINED